MTILEHIFTEFVDYAHHPNHVKSKYNALSNLYSATLDQFLLTLTPEQKATIFKLEEQRNLIAAMDEEHMFCYGLSVGVKLILEILYF